MAQLYLIKKLQGLFGNYNKVTATETSQKFNAETEVTRLAGGRRDDAFFCPARASATAAQINYLAKPRTKKLVRGVTIIPQAALASNATNYVVIKLQRTDGSTTSTIATVINTAQTALTALIAVSASTLSNTTAAAATRVIMDDGAAGTVDVPAFQIQIDWEEAK
jgi:hypothetical protein